MTEIFEILKAKKHLIPNNLYTNLWNKNSEKNLWNDSEKIVNLYSYYNDNGVLSHSSASGFMENYVKVKPSTKYEMSGKICTDMNYRYAVYYYDSNKQWIERIILEPTVGFNIQDLITPPNCYFIRIQFNVGTYDSSTWKVIQKK